MAGFFDKLKSLLGRKGPESDSNWSLPDDDMGSSESDFTRTRMGRPALTPDFATERTSFSDRFGSRLDDITSQLPALGGQLAKKSDFYVTGLAVILCAFIASDLISLGMQQLIPDVPAIQARRSSTQARRQMKTLDQYSPILSRNLFNTLVEDDGAGEDPAGKPVASSLPYDLVGTLVMQKPEYSIATLFDRQKKRVFPVRPGEEIPNVLRVTEVTGDQVIFVNLSQRRNEFIKLPENPNLKSPVIRAGQPAGGVGANIKKTAPNHFAIPRTEVQAAISNLNNILTQARAVPHPEGFRLSQIKPGSIFSTLGLQNGDVISGIDGEPASIQKAMELMQRLGEVSSLELNVKRDNQPQTFTYDIN